MEKNAYKNDQQLAFCNYFFCSKFKTTILGLVLDQLYHTIEILCKYPVCYSVSLDTNEIKLIYSALNRRQKIKQIFCSLFRKLFH